MPIVQVCIACHHQDWKRLPPLPERKDHGEKLPEGFLLPTAELVLSGDRQDIISQQQAFAWVKRDLAVEGEKGPTRRDGLLSNILALVSLHVCNIVRVGLR